MNPAHLFNATLASASISAAFELGIFSHLAAKGDLSLDFFCKTHELDASTIRAIANVLACFDIVVFRDSALIVGPGKSFDAVYRDKGYFMWLIGGYGYALQRLSDLARLVNRPSNPDDRSFVKRDGKYIAMAGRDYGEQFVDCDFEALLNPSPDDILCDLGCGSAGRLIGLVKKHRGLRGIGIDIDAGAVGLAQDSVRREGLEDQVQIISGDITALGSHARFADVTLLCCFFMGHDLWPRDRCLRVLNGIRACFPNVTRFLLCDTYNSELKPALDTPIFTLGFEFLHSVMGQYIPSLREWSEIFSESQWRCQDVRTIGIPYSAIFVLSPIPDSRRDAVGTP